MQKRKIMITGSTRGIGRSIAYKLIREGHMVSMGVRNLQEKQNLFTNFKEEERYRMHNKEYNAENKGSAESWVSSTIEQFGSIDTLIISAGIFRATKFIFSEEDEKDIKDLLNVNLMGPWYLMRAAWNELVKSGCGRIIVISSMSGKRSRGYFAGYCVSKFGLMGLCQTIRNEGWDKDVRITTLCPGWVNTDMAKNVKDIKKEDMTQPEDIAEICSNLLKLPKGSIPFEIKINCSLEK